MQNHGEADCQPKDRRRNNECHNYNSGSSFGFFTTCSGASVVQLSRHHEQRKVIDKQRPELRASLGKQKSGPG